MKCRPLLLVLALDLGCDDSDDPDVETTTNATSVDADDDAGSDTNDDADPPSVDCEGAITDCTLATLSASQHADYCDLLLAALDAEPGARFECADSGIFVEVATRQECVGVEFAPTCMVKVGEIIDCFQAAEQDACAAFDGPCVGVFSPDNGCSG